MQKMTLLSAASRWNKGKLHLGYVFAKDSSLATARAMVQGSCSFVPILSALYRRHLHLAVSRPFTYDVIRGSQMTVEQVVAQFRLIDDLIERAQGLADGYPVAIEPTRLLPQSSRTSTNVVASVKTSEVSIGIGALLGQLVEEINGLAGITTHTRCSIESIQRQEGENYLLRSHEGDVFIGYSHMINASWQNVLHSDSTVGHPLPDSWSHRYKYAVHFHNLPQDLDIAPATGVLGKFGDVVKFSDTSLYLSWYPACRKLFSYDIRPVEIGDPSPAEHERIIDETIAGASTLWPDVVRLKRWRHLAVVKGGYIYARGNTDIDDSGSLLHNRSLFGVSASGNYISVDTGKLCTAPLVGLRAAARVVANLVASLQGFLDL